jgi:hypothetical protein
MLGPSTGKRTHGAGVYLVDTDVVSEARKGLDANAGVRVLSPFT